MYDKGYEIEKLAPNVWAFALGQGMVRAFLVAGETSALLIDTGVGGVDLRAAVRTCTALPVRVVNTHGHFDHISGNGGFDMAFAHPMELAALSKAGFEARPVREGEGFDLGGRVMMVISLPGHTPGSIGLWESVEGLFFAGDSVAKNRPVFMCLDGASVEAFARSMERILSLENDEEGGCIRRIFCAHGEAEAGMETVRNLRALAQGLMDGTIAREPIPDTVAGHLPDGATLARYEDAGMYVM